LEHHRHALALYLQIGHQIGQAQALNGIGEALHAMGHSEQACEEHEAALTVASRSGDLYEQARAHEALAHSLAAPGDSRQARRHLMTALDLYTSLGVPEADDIRARLAAPRTRENNPLAT
jgi:tetratricopeptide (TPR) repeat protein